MKKNLTAKFSIKKAVNPSHRSGFFSHVFFRLTSICLCLAVAVSAMAIPAFAVESDVEWVQLELTPSDLYNIFAGSVSSSITFRHAAAPAFTTYDLLNQTTSTVGSSTSSNVFLSLDENGLLFYFPYIYEYRMISNTTVNYYFDLDLPFSYRFDSENLSGRIQTEFLIGAPSSNINSSSMTLEYVFDGLTYSVTPFMSSVGDYHFNRLYYFYDPYLNTFPWLSSLTNLQNSIVYDVLYIYNPSSTDIVDSLSFSFRSTLLSTYNQTYSYIQVPALLMKGFTVLVPQQIAADVNEYLDIITGSPSPEQSLRISQLERKFSEIDEALSQSAQDMEVEIPDISNKLDTLPPEVTQGNSMVSTNIYTPMLNIPFVTTIFTALFSFLALKLILHGGGKK